MHSFRARKGRIQLAAACEMLETRRLLCWLHQDDAGIPEPPTSGPADFRLDPKEIKATRDNTPLKVGFSPKTVSGPTLSAALTTPAPSGGFNGKIAYVSMGHGWTWTGSSWATQRPEYNEVVEDFGTQDQGTFYANYMLNAGATVVPMRPIGHQTNEVIVDNSDAAFTTPVGSWSSSTGQPYWSNNNGSDTAHYRYANVSATETAVARWTPTIPSAGFYPVYAWANNEGGNRASDHLFRINYAGGSAEVKANLSLTGKGWVYLGTYFFNSGTGGNVELSNKSSTTGKVVIADAIRFGNGQGDWNPGSGISGKPREEEASLYWLYRSRGYSSAGTLVAASNVDGGIADDNSANVGAPPRWSAYMNDSGQGAFNDRIFLSFHSNGGGGSARGNTSLINSANPTTNQTAWATAMSAEVEGDLTAIGNAGLIEHTWGNYSNTLSGSYGEISNLSTGGEFDATLLEVAFHDNTQDAELLRDPKVRNHVARAAYQATAKFLLGSGTTLMPDPPSNVRATTNSGGNVILAWTAPGTGTANGGAGAATGYRIYTGSTGYGWDDYLDVGNVTSHTFSGLSTTAVTYFKVTAINAGGESISFNSDVVAAKPQAGRRAPILIVNGFDRLDRTTDDTEPYSGGDGITPRVRYRYNNTRDYAIQVAEAVEAFNPNLGIETTQNEAVISGTINLANYHTVIWISGEESTDDHTFDATEQTKVTNFINGGGKFLASGAEIGWDLDLSGNGVSFYNNTLHAAYSADDANTYTVAGDATSIFNGITNIVFDNGANEGTNARTYDVEYADVINPSAGSTSAMTYSAGGTAAVQWASGNAKVVTMGFPFETITTATKRNAVMSAVLTYFDTASTLLSATPGAPNLLAATDSGSSSSDDRTNYNNSAPAKALQFTVSGTVAGATVTIYDGASVLISAAAPGATTTLTTSGASSLAEGNHTLNAKQTESGRPESAASGSLIITIDTTAPAAPSGESYTSSSTQVAMDWNNNVESDLWSYDVYRAATSGGSYSKINGAPVLSSAYTDTPLTPGTNYFYAVRAVDTAGNASVNSNEVAATTVPLDPSSLAAATVGGFQIDLAWSLPGGNRDGLVLERRSGSDPFAAIATLAAGTTGYQDQTGLSPDTSYDYRLRAYTGSTYSGASSASATTFKPGDADGSGIVDIDDLFRIDYGFANHLTGWSNGDFNNDGAINSLDYDIIYAVF